MQGRVSAEVFLSPYLEQISEMAGQTSDQFAPVN